MSINNRQSECCDILITRDHGYQTDFLEPLIGKRLRRQIYVVVGSGLAQDIGQCHSRLVSFRLKYIGLGPKSCLELHFGNKRYSLVYDHNLINNS